MTSAVPAGMIEQFIQSHRFLLACHQNPDGDAVGSLLGLALALQSQGKQVATFCADPIPSLYQFLPGWQQVRDGWDPVLLRGVDRIVALDTASPERLGPLGQAIAAGSAPVINIDHHEGNPGYGNINWVRPAAATGVLVYRLLEQLSWDISPRAALCLFTALSADTGSFRYDNTDYEGLTIAAELTRQGAQPAIVNEALYESQPLPALRLLGRALHSLSLSADGRLAWMVLSGDDFHQTGSGKEHAEGLANVARSIAGVEMGILIQEAEPGTVRINLRSGPGVDVNAMAASMGGGGHARAAGCKLHLPLHQAQELVLGAARVALERGGNSFAGDAESVEASRYDLPRRG